MPELASSIPKSGASPNAPTKGRRRKCSVSELVDRLVNGPVLESGYTGLCRTCGDELTNCGCACCGDCIHGDCDCVSGGRISAPADPHTGYVFNGWRCLTHKINIDDRW